MRILSEKVLSTESTAYILDLLATEFDCNECVDALIAFNQLWPTIPESAMGKPTKDFLKYLRNKAA